MHKVRKIRISSDLAFPLHLVTESIAILARKRAGKSYAAKRIVEQLHLAGQQVVVVDPKGDWWGLKSSSNGKHPGIPIVVLGGEHGDVPLEVGSGELVARLIVERVASVVLDLSEFRKHEVATFMSALLETIYRLKAKEQYRTPVMIVIDEADAIAPQSSGKNAGGGGNQERMLGAAQDIVRRGGQRGIGSMFITQRAAVLNKSVLTQASVLLVLQTTGSQDLDAVKDWIGHHGNKEQQTKLISEISSLPRGHAWVWAPGWPTETGIFQRVAIAACETFDSGATPKAGERRVMPKKVAKVDLEAFRREMAATIERAQAEDPKELQKTVVELKRRLRVLVDARIAQGNAPKAPKEREVREKIVKVEVPAVTPRMLKAIERTTTQMERSSALLAKNQKHADQHREILEELSKQFREAVAHLQKKEADAKLPASSAPGPAWPRPSKTTGIPRSIPIIRSTRSCATAKLGKAENLILTVLAQYHPASVTHRSLAAHTEYAHKGGGFNNALIRLRSLGLITGNRKQSYTITHEGLVRAENVQPLPVGRDLMEYWLDKLGKAEAAILRVVVNAHPRTLTKYEIADRTIPKYDPDGGGFNNALGRLRTMELIDKSKNPVPNPSFFKDVS